MSNGMPGAGGPPFPKDDKKNTARSFAEMAKMMGHTSIEKDGDDTSGGGSGEPKAPEGKAGFSIDDTKRGMEGETTVPGPDPDVLSTDAPQAVTVKRPLHAMADRAGHTQEEDVVVPVSGKNARDRGRQKRAKSAPVAPEADKPEEPPVGLFGGKGDKSAQMQAGIDADSTLRETKTSLREGVAKIEMENLRKQEVVVQEAQSEYFEALALRQKNRGSLTVIAENFTGDLGGSKELKALRTAWVRARAGHAFTQQAALKARLTESKSPRDEMLDRLKYKTEEYAGQFDIQKRYERMVTVRSVVTGAEEAERAVSVEALNSRDKKTFEKMNDWYMKKVPASVRIFGTSAALFGGAALLAGNPVGLAALGLVGTSAALRFWAEKTNGPILKSVLTTGARFASIPGAFGALADYGVRFGHRIAGTEVAAASTLAQREGLGNLASMKNLEHISSERKKALVAKETIARHGRLAGILTSIGAGWLFGHFGPGHPQSHVDTTEGTTTAGPDNSPEGAGKVEVAHTPAATVPAAPAATALAEVVPVAPAHPTTPDGLMAGATIDRPGEGFGELIVELKGSLPSVENPSPALAHVLNTNPNILTHEIEVASGGQSLTMQPGDKLIADNDQNVWLQQVGKEPVLLFENDPTAPGGFRSHDFHGHMQVDGGVRAEAPRIEAIAHSTSAPSIEAPAVTVTPQWIIPSENAPASTTPESGVTIQSGPEVLSQSEVDVIQGSSISAEASEVAPTAPAVPAREQAPTTPAPTAAPEAAPVKAPAPAQAPEQVPVPAAASEAVSAEPHPFASPDAPPLLNANGVDLNKSQVLMNEGRWFAHGANVDDSYERAVAQSQALALAGEPNNVYFVVPETDVTGRESLAVRMVFTPPDGSTPQMAPYGEGLQTGAQFAMPPVPKDADYQLPPRK